MISQLLIPVTQTLLGYHYLALGVSGFVLSDGRRERESKNLQAVTI